MNATIWSQSNCGFCDQAKSLLKSKGIEFTEKKIGSGYTKKDLLEVVPNARSVPQIFLGDEYIGGFDALQTKLKGTL